MNDETRVKKAERKSKERMAKRKDRKEARLSVRAFVGEITLMSKIIRLVEEGEDASELFEEWLNK